MKYIKSLEYLWALISSQPRIDAQSAPEIVYRNDWFSVECVSYPDALEKSWSLYTVVCRDWVNIVPVTPERDVVLLVEYKYGVGRWVCREGLSTKERRRNRLRFGSFARNVALLQVK
jgi:hypothetical protein